MTNEFDGLSEEEKDEILLALLAITCDWKYKRESIVEIIEKKERDIEELCIRLRVTRGMMK